LAVQDNLKQRQFIKYSEVVTFASNKTNVLIYIGSDYRANVLVCFCVWYIVVCETLTKQICQLFNFTLVCEQRTLTKINLRRNVKGKDTKNRAKEVV